ncbi:DNA polymerase III subunit alpha, partial [bacterium]|nr:DNA polymerase III subunit alpha [bacterium]
DIVALVALYRPGPLDSGMAESYVKRKHGQEEVVYLFDELEPVLKETYGVILYQEQVMKIGGVLANYSMADADGLRKAMGKKIVSMMEEHRDLFLKGAKENNHDLKKAAQLFDLMEKFGGYGFNKSHSAAYALIAYQTAYLKANFALEFIAALMTSERNNSDAVIKYMDECRTHEIKVLPPDVNKSDSHFNVSDNCIRFGLAAIKNVGEAAIESIIESRKKEEPFETIYDFCEKVSKGKVNKKTLEALIKCGALDSTNTKRSQLMVVLEDAMDHGSRIQKEKASAQLDLFADTNMGAGIPVNIPKLPDITEWDENFLLTYEKESLGFYISGHPLDKYDNTIKNFTTVNSISIHDCADEKMIRIGGTIKILKLHKTKKGDMMAFCAIEDQSGSIEVVVFPNLYVKAHTFISDEQIVIIEAKVQKKENIVKLIAETIVPIDDAQKEWTNSILISLDTQIHPIETLDKIKAIIQMYPGDATTCLKIQIKDMTPVMVRLGNQYNTCNDRDFFEKIIELSGQGSIEVKCAPIKEPPKKNRPWLKKKSG